MTTVSSQNIMARLGVRRAIGARARRTRLGGSIMAPHVWEAMREAGRTLVDMHELQDRVGERVAELTHNEAAYVTSGAAAGLVLSTAACVTGTDPALIDRLPHLEGLKNEIVMHRFQRNNYDINVRAVGVKLVEIGGEATYPWELEAAIGPRTAAVLYFVGHHVAKNLLPLDKVMAVAKERGVPVIVDAAAQLPPSHNLWHYTEMGAALVIFSGGKTLGGPQNTGMILGRRDLIAACKMMGSPSYAIGRPFKVGREEMVGFLAALEYYLETGEKETERRCEEWTARLVEELSRVPGVRATRLFPNYLTQPLAEVFVEFDGSLGVTGDEIVRRLWEGDPRIEVRNAGERAIRINPDPMQEGDLEIVAAHIKRAVQS